jgi:hypothetical protein
MHGGMRIAKGDTLFFFEWISVSRMPTTWLHEP